MAIGPKRPRQVGPEWPQTPSPRPHTAVLPAAAGVASWMLPNSLGDWALEHLNHKCLYMFVILYVFALHRGVQWSFPRVSRVFNPLEAKPLGHNVGHGRRAAAQEAPHDLHQRLVRLHLAHAHAPELRGDAPPWRPARREQLGGHGGQREPQAQRRHGAEELLGQLLGGLRGYGISGGSDVLIYIYIY